MGMYDEIYWEGNPNKDDHPYEPFQTKSLDCTLSNYTITKDGELMHFDKKCAYFTGEIRFYHPTYVATVIEGNVTKIVDDHGNVVFSKNVVPKTCPNCGHNLDS